MLLRECHTPDTPFNFIVGLSSILYKFQEIVTIFLTSIKLVFIVLSGILEIYVHFLVFQMLFFSKNYTQLLGYRHADKNVCLNNSIKSGINIPSSCFVVNYLKPI